MTRRDEGRGEGGMRGNAPEAKGQLSFAVRRPSPSVLPSFFFCAAACLHTHANASHTHTHIHHRHAECKSTPS